MNDKYKGIVGILFETEVAGITFRGLEPTFLPSLKEIDPSKIIVTLEREPTNEYDVNAIKVIVGVEWSKTTYFIGYIPRDLAVILSDIIDNTEYNIKIEHLIVVGGSLQGNYGVRLKYTLKN